MGGSVQEAPSNSIARSDIFPSGRHSEWEDMAGGAGDDHGKRCPFTLAQLCARAMVAIADPRRNREE